jgi:hypothetical protein
MSALPNINDVSAVEPPAIEISELTRKSNSGHNPMANPPRIREAPPFKPDDSLLKDALAAMMQSMADEKESRREDRELNRALIAKLANGNSTNKWTIQAAAAVIGVVLVVGAYVVGIASSNQSLIKDVQFQTQRNDDQREYIRKLEDRLSLAEVDTRTLREKLFAKGVLSDDNRQNRKGD